MTPSICIDPLYPSLLTEDKIPRVAAAGFRHVEFWSCRDKDIPAIEAAPDRLSPVWSFANGITKLLGTKIAIGHEAPMAHRS